MCLILYLKILKNFTVMEIIKCINLNTRHTTNNINISFDNNFIFNNIYIKLENLYPRKFSIHSFSFDYYYEKVRIPSLSIFYNNIPKSNYIVSTVLAYVIKNRMIYNR